LKKKSSGAAFSGDIEQSRSLHLGGFSQSRPHSYIIHLKQNGYVEKRY